MTSVKYEYYDEAKTKVKMEIWKKNGKEHRIDGPADIWYNESGRVKYKSWYLNGKRHRIEGPTSSWYYESGRVKSESWYLDGKAHRIEGPAYIDYYESGSVKFELWYLDEKCHRTDGPAHIWYYESGRVEFEVWYLDGKPHRLDGPARIEYSNDVNYEWWLFGTKYNEKMFNLIIMNWNALFWSRKIRRSRHSRELIEWWYGPTCLGGRLDRRDLRNFAMGIQGYIK